MSKTTTRKVRIVRRATAQIPFGVLVNVKVQGQRLMLKRVTLAPSDRDPFAVKVLTGRRGRPAILPLDNIERVRAI